MKGKRQTLPSPTAIAMQERRNSLSLPHVSRVSPCAFATVLSASDGFRLNELGTLVKLGTSDTNAGLSKLGGILKKSERAKHVAF
jgi:hypothetical protein